VAWCYGLKFLPSIIILLSIYATTLMAFCTEVTLDCKPVSTCNWVYPSQNGTVFNENWSGWTSASHQYFLYKIQHTIAFAFVFYLGMAVKFWRWIILNSFNHSFLSIFLQFSFPYHLFIDNIISGKSIPWAIDCGLCAVLLCKLEFRWPSFEYLITSN